MSDVVPAVLILLPPSEKGAKSADRSGAGSRIPVQFNPTSLRLQRQSSQKRSGMVTKNQQVQYPSTQAATLSFDLEFDSAEDVSGGRAGQSAARPVDVRTRSGRITALTRPATADPAGAPHRVRFEWGSFAFQGVVTQTTEEYDYFAPDGTPLRCKVSVTIEEQDPAFEANAKGAGARTDSGAPLPGGAPARPPLPGPGLRPPPGATPGRAGTSDPLRSVAARQGESVQQVAAREGGDPSAWRALMTDLSAPTGLAAGTPVIVGPELDTPSVIGRALGFAAGAAASPVDALASALGLAATTARGRVAGALAAELSGAGEAAGFALTAAGGLAAATGTVRAAEATASVAAERSGFAVPAAAAEALAVDPRALTFGRTVPLRSRVNPGTAEDARTGGRRSLGARAQPAELPVTTAAAGRPWERLPPAASGRAAADEAQRGRDARASTMRWRPGGGCR